MLRTLSLNTPRQQAPTYRVAAQLVRRGASNYRRRPALLTTQVGLGLGPSQLFDHRLDLRRIAKQPDPAADPATGLQAERGLRLLIARVGHQLGDSVDCAGAFQQRFAC